MKVNINLPTFVPSGADLKHHEQVYLYQCLPQCINPQVYCYSRIVCYEIINTSPLEVRFCFSITLNRDVTIHRGMQLKATEGGA